MAFIMKARIIITAKRVGEHYGIPWQLIAGVACLESGYGKSLSAKHNYIGIKHRDSMWKLKGSAVKTKESWGSTVARFVAFISMEHCFGYMAETILFSMLYAPVRLAIKNEQEDEMYQRFAKIWATDEQYYAKLRSVIDYLEGVVGL